jgi:uncharacterized protein YndB with AHSA1/START domain
MADTRMTTESTVYVTYIASTPEKVWAALTSSEFTTQYFFSRSVESDWKEGSPWILRTPDGNVDVRGEVRESSSPQGSSSHGKSMAHRNTRTFRRVLLPMRLKLLARALSA